MIFRRASRGEPAPVVALPRETRPRASRGPVRRALLASSAALALVTATVVAGGSTAQAATTTQRASCTDGGGHVWTGRSVWGVVYTDSSGRKRVRNNDIAFTSAAPDATTVDYTIRTYNGDGRLIQTIGKQNRRFAFARGTAYLSRNPRNPISSPGRSRIVVEVGDGNDHRLGCRMTFVQPGAVSPPPTPPNPPTTTPTGAVATFITGYTWWDNSPPGSAAIARPVLHRTAGGVGTYADPITMAVGFTKAGLDIPAGTMFYLPNRQKYFIVEDICGACHRTPAGTRYKLDIWLDGRQLSKARAHACAARITGKQLSIRNPPRGLTVRTGAICSVV